MTQCAAMDYGKHGITANSYSPGVIETPLSTLSLDLRSFNPLIRNLDPVKVVNCGLIAFSAGRR